MSSNQVIQEVTSAIIAILSVIGAFCIVFYELVNGRSVNVPGFVSLLIGAVVGSYLTRVASVNGARQAGTAAAQTTAGLMQTSGGTPNVGSSTTVR